MEHTKKIIAAFLALVIALAPYAATVQASPTVPKSMVIYLRPKSEPLLDTYFIPVRGLADSQSPSDPKSSNTKIINVVAVNHSHIARDQAIGFTCHKIGTSTISFKIGSKTYRTKVTSKKYENPVRSLSITGIKNNGKTDLARLTDKATVNPSLKTSTPKAAPTLKVSAKKGWKVSQIDYLTKGAGDSTKKYKKAVSSATLKMKKDTNYIYVDFTNTKTKGIIRLTYGIDLPA